MSNYPIELLHWAGMNEENLPILKKILAENPEYINTVNSYNDNALIIAVRTGNLEIVKFLVNETNININHQTKEGNALCIALEYNKKDIANFLLTTNIDIFCLDNNGANTLFLSALNNNETVFDILVERGVNINHLNNRGENILFYFIQNYIQHKNYLFFDSIQDKLNNNIIIQKNINNKNIIEIMEEMIEDSHTNNNIIRENRLRENFPPLFHALSSYFN